MEKPKKNRDVFWDVLPKYMELAQMRQVDLAKAVGVSKSTVHCWIAKKSFPEIDTIQKIADALNCKTDDLLIEAPEPHYSYSNAYQDPHIRTDEDIQLQRLWQSSSINAKRAALAVLIQIMKDEEDDLGRYQYDSEKTPCKVPG